MISSEAFMDIIALKRAGHSNRFIARKLGIHRKTVKKHLEANAFPAYTRSVQKPSVLEPFHPIIKGFLDEDDYQATWILERIRKLGYAGSYRKAGGTVVSKLLLVRIEDLPPLHEWGSSLAFCSFSRR